MSRTFTPPKTSAGTAAALADLTRRREQANANRPSHSSGGGGAKPVTITLGSELFYYPRTLGKDAQKPMPAEDWKLVAKGESTRMILCDPGATIVMGHHKLVTCTNPAALPFHMRSLQNRTVMCHAGRTPYNADKPLDAGWKEDPSRAGGYLLRSKVSAKSTRVFVLDDHGVVVEPPSGHPSVMETEAITVSFSEYGDEALEAAQRYAEQLLHEADECPWCEHDTHNRESPVWRARDAFMLPAFSLRWQQGVAVVKKPGQPDSQYERPGFQFDYKTPQEWAPGKRDLAIRLGWSVIALPQASNKSQRGRTMDEYVAHVGRVGEICAHCLAESGARLPAMDVSSTINGRTVVRKEAAHRLSIVAVRCPVTQEVLMSADRAAALSDAERYELNSSYFPSEPLRNLIESGGVTLEELQASGAPCYGTDTGEIMVAPALTLECNTCENPTPLRVSQVITTASKMEEGYLTFAIHEADGILRRNWANVPGTSPSELSVADLAVVDVQDVEAVKAHLDWGVVELYAGHMDRAEVNMAMAAARPAGTARR